MTEQQKQRIDHYIKIYLSSIQSVSNDAGFQTYSIMARFLDFRGDMPPPSGNDQSNVGLMNAIRLLRGRHAKLPEISGAVASLMKSKPDEMLALLARNFYVGQCEWTEKPFTENQRAEEIGQDLDGYRYNLKKAYRSYQIELESAERYREFFGMVTDVKIKTQYVDTR